MTLLVAYGSKHGSTQEVAEAVAERLRAGGREVDLLRAADVDDLTPYGGVVLGGSLYVGRWHEDARRFLSKYREELSALPLAVFALGPKTAEQKDLADARTQLDKALSKTPELEPRSVAVFGGVIDPSKLRFPLNRLPASDARDWDAIDAWVDELGAT
jgi:menaquinone-dependent protoporphyrinogen oxidase